MSPSRPLLTVVDILDDPDHSFTQVFNAYLEQEGLDVSWQGLNGLEDDVDYAAVLEAAPSGVLISGSLQSVYARKPWMLKLEAFIQAAQAREIPIFGICFGHQILASALGGRVETLPTWEFGEHPVFLQGEHPYLKDFDSGSLTLQVHQDHVAELPPGAVALGLSEKTPHQIFAIGKSFGVQFHPEYTVEMLHTIIAKRHEKFVEKGPFLSESHLQELSQHWGLPQAPRQILRRFLETLLNENAL